MFESAFFWEDAQYMELGVQRRAALSVLFPGPRYVHLHFGLFRDLCVSDPCSEVEYPV